MQTEQEIYDDYLKFSVTRPTFFRHEYHWKAYYEGYEGGYRDGVEEMQKSFEKEMGMDLVNFPTNTEEQLDVMRKALKQYYKSKTDKK